MGGASESYPDWSDSKIWKTAQELFPAEDAIEGERSIHAWGLDKAAEYFNVLFKWAEDNIHRRYVSALEHHMLFLDLHHIMEGDNPFTADELERAAYNPRYSAKYRKHLEETASQLREIASKLADLPKGGGANAPL